MLRLVLERPAAQGRTVASHGGFTILVARGAAGETVDAQVDRVAARHGLAHVVRVLAPSPERAQPPCPHYNRCGGCDLQHLAYAAQLAVKQAALRDQLVRIGGLADPPLGAVLPAPLPLRYRDRLDFLLHAEPGEPPVPAFHGAHGGPPESIDDCWLAPPALTALAHAAAQGLSGLRTESAGVRLRVQACAATGPADGLALTVVAPTATAARKLAQRAPRWLPGLLAGQPALAHVSVAVSLAARDEDEDEAAARATVLHGEGTLVKTVGARRYRVPAEGFFQVHPAQTERLAAHVTAAVQAELAALPPAAARLVLDLYCGAGLFTLPLAAAGVRVAGVELSPEAVRAARLAAREGDFAPGAKPEFKVRDLEEPGALEELTAALGRPGVVLLDPPRRGLAPTLVRGLLAVRPEAIVYVSCDGGTFARDAARLGARYTLVDVQAFDLFPQTHHVELVGVFRRRA